MQQYIAKITVPIVHTEKVQSNHAYKQPWCIQKLSIAKVQTNVVNSNNACHLQFLHTKAITAMTQFSF